MIETVAQTGVNASEVIDPIVFAGIGGVIAVTLIGIITVIAGYLQETRALSAVVNTNTVQTVDRAQEDEKGGN
jgi:hypothetical protein